MTTTSRRIVHDAGGHNTGVWPVPATRDIVSSVEQLFTRSHAATPAIDAATWRLEVRGLVERPLTVSLDDLRRAFTPRTVTATLVCAGMRRAEFQAVREVRGELPWGPEAAGTGAWTGAALTDVLAASGVAADARYVELIGLDQVEREGRRFGLGSSIDLTKVRAGDIVLAWALNGAPLPAAHGFPLRAVVPGWIGARSVKWLGHIVLADRPSENYFHTKAYRLQTEVDPRDPRDVSAGTPITDVPINAVILEPTSEQAVRAGRVAVRGWAMGAGGAPIARVEISVDDGESWIDARIVADGAPWAWTLWTADVELAPGRHVLAVRATDRAGTTQPREVADTWNVKGYCNNAWHRVAVVVGEPSARGHSETAD